MQCVEDIGEWGVQTSTRIETEFAEIQPWHQDYDGIIDECGGLVRQSVQAESGT